MSQSKASKTKKSSKPKASKKPVEPKIDPAVEQRIKSLKKAGVGNGLIEQMTGVSLEEIKSI